MFSITTIEFATSTPTETDNPINVIIFNERPNTCKRRNVEMIDVGIDIATTNVERQSCKNRNKTIAVKITPR